MPRPAGVKQHTKVEETELRKWAYRNGYNIPTFAILIGATKPTVFDWFYGSSIPSLIQAIRIEKVTSGEVPCTYWVGTKLGKYMYDQIEEKLLNSEEAMAKIKNRKRADGLAGGKAAIMLNRSQKEMKAIRDAEEIKRANKLFDEAAKNGLDEIEEFVE